MDSKIETLIEGSLRALGYTIVRVTFGGRVTKVLQIMIERIDDKAITVDDCALVSRHVSPLIEAEEAIECAYHLEVSSAGINRPLIKPGDFIKYTGKNISVKTHRVIVDRKRLKGLLLSANEEGIVLKNESGEIPLSYQDILSACLNIEDII